MNWLGFGFRATRSVMRGANNMSQNMMRNAIGNNQQDMGYRGPRRQVPTGGLNNAQTQQEIEKMHQKAIEENTKNRQVFIVPSVKHQDLLLTSSEEDKDIIFVENSPSLAFNCIWGNNPKVENTVVSGGENDSRIRALIPFVQRINAENSPLVVLHNGNQKLEEMLKNYSKNYSKNCECIGKSLYYNAFESMDSEDISSLLEKIMPQPTITAAKSLLQAVIKTIWETQNTVNFQNLANFPMQNGLNILENAHKKTEISTDEYNETKRKFLAGSAEMDSVKNFLDQLNRQAANIYKSSKMCSNISKTINQKGKIAIDIGNSNNELIFSLVIEHLKFLQDKQKFAILLDNIAISRFPKVADLLNGKTYAISHNDFISSLFGGEKNGDDIFTELAGNISTIVLFNHSSGTSCKKWSEHLGTYHKNLVTYNISQNNAFMNSSDSRGISVNETEEPRIRADTLGKLGRFDQNFSTLACIRCPTDEIIFAEI
ncbi:MAG: hypothetical protein FWG64_09505 [Firmicutes bacterium]|nr:hypothetical protein [Bacillota bacterium]